MNRINSFRNYEAVLVVVVGLLIIFFFSQNIWFARVGFIVGMLGLLSKTVAYYITVILSKVTSLLGWVNSRLLLSIIFFVFLFPLALLYRLTKRDFLNLRKSNESMYKERNHIFLPEDLKNIW